MLMLLVMNMDLARGQMSYVHTSPNKRNCLSCKVADPDQALGRGQSNKGEPKKSSLV